MKTCGKCKEKKAAAEFSRDCRSPDGRARRCRLCNRRAVAEWQKNNPENHRKSDAKWSAKNRHVKNSAYYSYAKRHPNKVRAHQAVQKALKSGRLKKRSCTICRKKRAHAHHDDYSKVLDVIWLCHKHHLERHVMLDKDFFKRRTS